MSFFEDFISNSAFSPNYYTNNQNNIETDNALTYLEIGLRKQEFENNLNEMWIKCSKIPTQQYPIYNTQVKKIKQAGYKVLRNSQGKHKIVSLTKDR